MEDNIVAQSERLILRKIQLDDVKFLFEIFNDPEVMRYYPSLKTLEQTKDWIAYTLKSYAEFGFGKWLILLKETQEPIGHCGLLQITVDEEDEIELGYFLARKFWGNGYAQEAARLAIEIGYKRFRCKRIISAINPENLPSIRVAKQLGMKMEKTGLAKAGQMTWRAQVFVV